MKVLLTGFEPFGGETINPSWEVAKRVSSEGVEGAEIVTALLPTVFGKSINEAVRVIEELKPDLVISLGQAGGSAEITVERVAINISDAGSPDNDNNQPVDIPIIEGGPAAYFSTLPIKAMVEDIRCAGIPARVSNTAGTFVCNHVMWGCGRFFGLDYAARPRLRRYSIGLIAPKDILIRSSLYQRRKPSSSYMNSSRETPSQDLV